jgi:hypothetical protein
VRGEGGMLTVLEVVGSGGKPSIVSQEIALARSRQPSYVANHKEGRRGGAGSRGRFRKRDESFFLEPMEPRNEGELTSRGTPEEV